MYQYINAPRLSFSPDTKSICVTENHYVFVSLLYNIITIMPVINERRTAQYICVKMSIWAHLIVTLGKSLLSIESCEHKYESLRMGD